MSTISINLQNISEYIVVLERLCISFVDTQTEIDNEYNILVDKWYDKIYLRTGAEIAYSGKRLQEFYIELVSWIRRLFNLGEKLSVYNENVWDVSIGNIPNFELRIKEDVVEVQSVNTDPNDIKVFERALQEYIEKTKSNVKYLARENANMADSWKDDNYVKFTDEVNSLVYEINNQMEILSACLERITKKRIMLESISESGI